MAKSAKPGVETPKLKKIRKKGEKKIKKQFIEETSEHEEEEVVNTNDPPETTGIADESGRSDEVAEEEQEMGAEDESRMLNNELIDKPKRKKKDRILKEATNADRRGICYLSRIPPHMDHVKLRHKLSQYGQILRIYLAPEDKKHQEQRKKRKDQGFSEGWVEFANKSNAKRVANMLNGEQIGGKKRSVFYYDLWNIKYLSKFKWDDLTEEIAYKSAIREQKLALELSAAKRERDFYLSKVEKSHALRSIEERLRKKQKVQQETGDPLSVTMPKVVRHFSQTKPVEDKAEEGKSNLSRDVLAGVFGASQ